MNEWQRIESAPRDGTPIELRNDYGIAPTYSLSKWVQDRGWVHANDDSRGVGDGPWLTWRPYEGNAKDYIDPTNGAQETPEYWRAASGKNGGWISDLFNKLRG